MALKVNSKPWLIFLKTVLVSTFFITDVFALQAEFKEIKKIEEKEKTQPQEVITRRKVEYTAGGLRDPFQTYIEEERRGAKAQETEEAKLPSLKVQGIIWGGSLPQAIVNNKVVKAGDIIEGVRIVEIKKDGIILFFSGRQYTLPSPGAGGSSKEKPEGG
jgi:hypothetical protein